MGYDVAEREKEKRMMWSSNDKMYSTRSALTGPIDIVPFAIPALVPSLARVS